MLLGWHLLQKLLGARLGLFPWMWVEAVPRVLHPLQLHLLLMELQQGHLLLLLLSLVSRAQGPPILLQLPLLQLWVQPGACRSHAGGGPGGLGGLMCWGVGRLSRFKLDRARVHVQSRHLLMPLLLQQLLLLLLLLLKVQPVRLPTPLEQLLLRGGWVPHAQTHVGLGPKRES